MTTRQAVCAAICLGLAFQCGTPAAFGRGTAPKKKPAAASKAVSSTKRKPGPARKAPAKASSVQKLSAAELKAQAAAKATATIQTVKLNTAFVATANLRPMAQQLAGSRSASAYANVSGYAQTHPGTQASTAYLALGHAYMLDHRYGDAADAFSRVGGSSHAAAAGEPALGDYAEYLGAQALIQGGRVNDALPLLDHFADRHPESIFTVNAPMLMANADLQLHNAPAAVNVLTPLGATPEADHADYKLILAKALQTAGDNARAAALYHSIFVNQPLTFEAGQAFAQLRAMGQPPTAAERKLRADTMFNNKRYSEASAEYSALRSDPSLSQSDRDGLVIYQAVCDLRLKHLSRHDVEKLPVTNDDTAALKLYLFAEISRNEKDRASHDAIIAQMVEKHPQSRWLEEALYSGGNMYLLTHDLPQAIYHYKLLVERFPASLYAPSAHWRDAWMNYRLRHYDEAARLMDEQVVRYGTGIEASSALYWRGRLYEDEEHNFPQAANYYRSLATNYPNFYYGYLARQRLAVLGQQPVTAPTPALAAVRVATVPDLVGVVPTQDPHYIKAKLLANAALNEYIGPELAASPGSGQWGALAQAQIYASFGETTRALQSIKKSGIPFFSIPFNQVPVEYWKLLFPQPYWSDLVADAQRNSLDPYLVASLIRQESEFNAGAVSPAHAYGLMQLLASVGQANARKEGLKGFSQGELLNPAINLQLGTRNLKGVLDRFGGQTEYALAAYNAGDVPIRQWMASGDYKDIAEYVESIPYTETREYVQAIVRNREMYRVLYPAH